MPASTKKSSSKPKRAAKKTTAKTKSTAQKKSTTTKATTAKRSPKKAAKKTAKKATKRATTKKAAEHTPRALVCADGEQCFWTTDGQILKDLRELRDALQHMDEEVFAVHVNRERNDFADWVEHVLQDAECAAALRRSQKQKTAQTVVVRHLKLYNA